VQATRRCWNRGRDAIRFAYGAIKDLRQSIFSKLSNNQSSCNYRRGIGAPSDAAKAMELGADAVLVNT
jgi:pyridoxal biosynthesis lyase PdxS